VSKSLSLEMSRKQLRFCDQKRLYIIYNLLMVCWGFLLQIITMVDSSRPCRPEECLISVRGWLKRNWISSKTICGTVLRVTKFRVTTGRNDKSIVNSQARYCCSVSLAWFLQVQRPANDLEKSDAVALRLCLSTVGAAYHALHVL
jgi:hypothetical protein